MNSLYSNLAAYWNLTEASGTRFSSNGLVNLTDNNTVGQATGVPLYAADFIRANSEYLYSADNAHLSMAANQDFSIVLWLRMVTNVNTMFAFAKIASSGANASAEYYLYFDSSANRLKFGLGNGSTYTELAANTLGAPSVGAWYFVYMFHDAVNDLIGIEVNTTMYDQAAWANGSQDTANGFAIGRLGDYSGATNFYWNGQICGMGIWKRTLVYAERRWLYNLGRGRLYPFDGRPFLDNHLRDGGRRRRNRDLGVIV